MLKSEVIYLGVNFTEEIEWLKVSFEGISIKEVKIPRIEEFNQHNANRDNIFYKMYVYFKQNPLKNYVSVKELGKEHEEGGITREELEQILKIRRRDFNISNRTSELKEILMLNQVIDTFEGFLKNALEVLKLAYPTNNSYKVFDNKLIYLMAAIQKFDEWFSLPVDLVKKVDEYKATRNVHTHKRGLIDQKYLDSFPDSGYLIYDYRSLKEEGYMEGLFQVVLRLSRFIQQKIDIQCQNDGLY